MCDSQGGLIDMLDKLSNRYLGTKGESKGSWDKEKGCYKGGIFTGCKTSANHEIWERYLMVISRYYKDYISDDFQLKTWSFPGSKLSWCYFEKGGKRFYDSDCKIPFNNLAKMPSSLFLDKDGRPKMRSWTDVLREFGYTVAHDAVCPGRMDGFPKVAMRYQLIANASLSRTDALVYPSNRVISFSKIKSEYPKEFFRSQESPEMQMYRVKDGSFRKTIETWRCWMSRGIVWSEEIDSNSTYSEYVFFDKLLSYCKLTGVELITKQEAYDICFNQQYGQKGDNIIFNPDLRNSASVFFKNDEVPTNPDGYEGDCKVETGEDGESMLKCNGRVEYIQMGLPEKALDFAVQAKGEGVIEIMKIKNNSPFELDNLEDGSSIIVNSQTSFKVYHNELKVANKKRESEDPLCDGYGEKTIGLKIVYSPGLTIKQIRLVVLE